MSKNEHSPDDFERLHLSQAVADAHKKILLAHKKDIALGDKNAAGSYGHRQDFPSYANGSVGRNFAIVLIPNALQASKAEIVRVGLTVPTVATDSADKILATLHQTNLQNNAPEDFDDPALISPRRLPTTDVFGEAFKNDGTLLRFLVNPSGLHAYEMNEDIIPAEPFAALDGQHYDVRRDSMFRAIEQGRMLSEWFDLSGLTEVIEAYEPTTFSGRFDVGHAA
jgi:hypothetical protein